MISTTYTISFNICISRLARYVDEITGNQQYGAACTKSTTCAFCIHKTLGGKNGNYTGLYTSYLQISTRPMVQFGGRFCIKFSFSVLSP